MRIGIIALQGDVSEHERMLQLTLDQRGEECDIVPIKHKGLVPSCDGLILTGGESTTLSRLLVTEGIAEEIIDANARQVPIMGTCAGMIVIAKRGDEQVERTGQYLLSIMDIGIKRNAFGRQRDSFEIMLDMDPLKEPYNAVFIRAPAIIEHGKDVNPLALFKDLTVAAEERNILALAFHPELTDDIRIHNYFLDKIFSLAEQE